MGVVMTTPADPSWSPIVQELDWLLEEIMMEDLSEDEAAAMAGDRANDIQARVRPTSTAAATSRAPEIGAIEDPPTVLSSERSPPARHQTPRGGGAEPVFVAQTVATLLAVKGLLRSPIPFRDGD